MINALALLTHDEIALLTGKQKFKAQQRVLMKMGVRHTTRPDGSLVVARAPVEAMLAIKSTPSPAAPAEGSMNLDALQVRRRKD